MHGSLTKINIRPVQRQQFSQEINEQLGNRAGMASSYGQLGMLLMETGSVEEALKYTLSSLLFFLQLGAPQARTLLGLLARERTQLGEQEDEK